MNTTDNLAEALQNLLDEQNGPPLVRHEKSWQAAVDAAEEALASHRSQQQAEADAALKQKPLEPEFAGLLSKNLWDLMEERPAPAASGGLTDLAHEIWAAAQLSPGEGIEDGASRISCILSASQPARYEQGEADGSDRAANRQDFDAWRRTMADGYTEFDAYLAGLAVALRTPDAIERAFIAGAKWVENCDFSNDLWADAEKAATRYSVSIAASQPEARKTMSEGEMVAAVRVGFPRTKISRAYRDLIRAVEAHHGIGAAKEKAV